MAVLKSLEVLAQDAGFGIPGRTPKGEIIEGVKVRALEFRLRDLMMKGGGSSLYMVDIAKRLGARPPQPGESAQCGIRAKDWGEVYNLFREIKRTEREKALFGLVTLPKTVKFDDGASSRIVGAVNKGSIAEQAGVKVGDTFNGFEENYTFADGTSGCALMVSRRNQNGHWEAFALKCDSPAPEAYQLEQRILSVWDHAGLEPKKAPKAASDAFIGTIDFDLSGYGSIGESDGAN